MGGQLKFLGTMKYGKNSKESIQPRYQKWSKADKQNEAKTAEKLDIGKIKVNNSKGSAWKMMGYVRGVFDLAALAVL